MVANIAFYENVLFILSVFVAGNLPPHPASHISHLAIKTPHPTINARHPAHKKNSLMGLELHTTSKLIFSIGGRGVTYQTQLIHIQTSDSALHQLIGGLLNPSSVKRNFTEHN